MSREYGESTSSQIPVIADGLTLGVIGAGVMGQTLIRGLFNSDLIAHNYRPLDVVVDHAAGVWVYDVEGNCYLDCLSAYSALNQGHCHPRIIAALREQAGNVTLTSRTFRNNQLPRFVAELAELCRMVMVLPMNADAKALEQAVTPNTCAFRFEPIQRGLLGGSALAAFGPRTFRKDVMGDVGDLNRDVRFVPCPHDHLKLLREGPGGHAQLFH
jgi:hypothetical protein